MTEVSKLLSEAAARLKQQAPGMSLRGVASRIEITPSYWSKILRGKKPLPPTLLPKIVKVLGLDTQQVAQLQRLMLETIERDQLVPQTGMRTNFPASSPIENYANLNRDQIWILDEWYYIPILNLCTVTGFAGKIENISLRLGLKTEQVKAAALRLKHYGYLREDQPGLFTRTDQKVRFPTSRSLAPVRQYHHAMMQKAREHLQSASDEAFAERLISAVCFAGSSGKMKEARLILEEAMYRVANLMADEPRCDEVYQVNVQIFPLTKRVCPA